MANESIKILTVDAGGVKGVYALSVLQSLEQQMKLSATDDFDYFVGSSIGGVLATALADGISVDLLFSELQLLIAEFAKGHRYLLQKLFKWIDQTFGDKKLSDIKSKIFLPVYNHTLKKAGYLSNTGNHSHILVKDALKASCADIRITEPHLISEQGGYFSDAGFFAYDPSVYFLQSGTVEINRQIKMLSIGSGIVENASHDLSANENFDIIYDSFLEEQFRTTQLVFDLLRDIHGLTYYRITEWPRTVAAFSLDQLPVLAHERVRNLDVKTLAAFRE